MWLPTQDSAGAPVRQLEQEAEEKTKVGLVCDAYWNAAFQEINHLGYWPCRRRVSSAADFKDVFSVRCLQLSSTLHTQANPDDSEDSSHLLPRVKTKSRMNEEFNIHLVLLLWFQAK